MDPLVFWHGVQGSTYRKDGLVKSRKKSLSIACPARDGRGPDNAASGGPPAADLTG